MRHLRIAIALFPCLMACNATIDSNDAHKGGDAGALIGADAEATDAEPTSAEAATDAATDAAFEQCDPAAVQNPAGCPAAYSLALNGTPCGARELLCLYPLAGDPDIHGCNSTAEMTCQASPSADGGADAGLWVCAQ